VRKLSIVIPVLGRLHLLEHSLVSVLENRPDDCEVLVVLNAPYDDPYDLAGEVSFVEARRGAGLLESIRAGLEVSQAPIVHLLACGVEVSEGWAATPLRQFKDPQVAAVAPLVLDNFHQDQIVTAGLCYRRGGSVRHVGQGKSLQMLGPWTAEMVGPSLLAGFYRKSALDDAGGLDPSLGASGAAADLALKLKSLGLRIVLDPKAKVYAPSAARTLDASTFQTALAAERMFLCHVADRQWAPALAAHLFVAAADILGSLPRPASLLKLLGRMCAWAQFSRCRQQHAEFLQLAAAAAERTERQRSSIPRPHIAPLAGKRSNSLTTG
jgi:GT2 family glycosyltransferase